VSFSETSLSLLLWRKRCGGSGDEEHLKKRLRARLNVYLLL
jgi:hypothetical protein